MNARLLARYGRASYSLVAGLALLSSANPAAAVDLYWVPNAGGNWNVAANWFNSQPPTGASGSDPVYIHSSPYLIAGSTGDFVTTITNAYTIQSLRSGASLSILSSGVLTLDGPGSAIDRNLVIDNGQLLGAGDLTVGGLLTFSYGTIGPGGLLTLNGGMLMSGPSSRTLSRNVRLNSDGFLEGGSVLAAGTFEIVAGKTLAADGGTWYEGLFTNNGTLRKNATGTSLSMGSNYSNNPRSFTNSGSVAVLGGSLIIRASGTHSGDFSVSQGATLHWAVDATMSAGSETSGAGTVLFSTGSQTYQNGSTLSATPDFSGSTVSFEPGSTIQNLLDLKISTGTVNLNTGANKALQTLSMTGGTIDGVDGLSFAGAASMSSGTIKGAGALTFNGPTSLGGSSSKTIKRAVQVNGNLTASGSVLLASSPVVIAPGVQWSIPGTLTWYEGNTTLNGVLTKSGSGVANIAQNYNNNPRSFTNNNLVIVNGGSVALRCNGTHPGDFEVAGGADLQLYETQTFTGGSSISGGGTLDVRAGTHTWQSGSSVTAKPAFTGGAATFLPGSVLTWTGNLAIDNCTVSLSTGSPKTYAGGSLGGGTLTGTDDLTFSQLFAWTSGTISGSSPARFNAGIELTGTSSRNIQRSILLDGASTIAGGSILAQSSSVELVEGASLTMDTATWYESNFVNNGTLVFNPSSTANWCINYSNNPRSFTNNGLVKALRNQTNIRAPGTHTGDFEIASGAQITLQENQTFATGSSVKGQGKLDLATGVMTFQSGSSVETPLEVSSGTATFEPGSNLANPTSLTIGTGSLTLNTGSQRVFSSLTMGGGKLQGSDGIVVQGDGMMGAGDLDVPGKITFEKRLDMLVAGARTWKGIVDLKGRTDLASGSLLTLDGCDVKIHPGSEFWLSGSSLMLYEGEYVNEGAIRRPAFASSNAARFGVNYQNNPRSIDNQGLIEALGNLQIESEVRNYSLDTQRLTGGLWRVGDGATLKIVDNVNVLTNAADVEFLGPNALFTNQSNLNVFANMDENQGSFKLFGGKTHTRTGNFLNGGLIETGVGSTFAATGQYRQTSGNTIVAGNHDAASFSLEGGNLKGTGSVGAPVANTGGVVSGGTSVGHLGLLYSYAQSGTGTMLAELRGTPAGEHDRLDVAGNVLLGGSLDVRMIPGYVANPGDTFRILTSGGLVSGTFDVEPDSEDWSVVYGANFVDVTANRQVFSPVTVSGKVELLDFQASSAGITVEIEVRQGGVVVQSVTVPLLADGSYSFATTRRDNSEVSFKPSHWLRRTVPGINFTDAGVQNLSVSLINGDVDNDNVVTVFDYNVLSDAFDSVEGDSNWFAGADLDGDGAVTVFDYNILSANFDEVGDD